MTTLRSAVVALVVAVFTAACVKTPPPDLYLLDSAAPTHLPGFEEGVAVGVGPVELAPHLDRSQIVSRDNPTKLKLSEGHQWGEPLKAGFTRVMLVNLGLDLNSNRIYEYPTRQRRRLDYQVAVDVLRFDGTLNDSVILGARWTLLSGDGNRVVLSKVSRIQETVNGDSYDAFVDAQSRAVASLAREIAGAIKEQMGDGG